MYRTTLKSLNSVHVAWTLGKFCTCENMYNSCNCTYVCEILKFCTYEYINHSSHVSICTRNYMPSHILHLVCTCCYIRLHKLQLTCEHMYKVLHTATYITLGVYMLLHTITSITVHMRAYVPLESDQG